MIWITALWALAIITYLLIYRFPKKKEVQVSSSSSVNSASDIPEEDLPYECFCPNCDALVAEYKDGVLNTYLVVEEVLPENVVNLDDYRD